MNRDLFRVFPCTEQKKDYKFVVRGRINGRYVRKYFTLKSDAEVWAEIKNIEASNQGTEHTSFSTSLRLQAQTAADLLAPHDVTLLEAVKIALPIIESRTKSITVDAALTQFFTDYRLHGGPKRAVVSASYLAYLNDMLGSFRKTYSNRLVCDVGVTEIEHLLGGKRKAGAVTRQSYVRAISAFYGWCVRRGFRMDNPLSKLRKRLPKADVTILSIADTQKLLNAADEEELPVLVLALFCGIRIAEFRKLTRNTRGEENDTWLDWKNVDMKAKQVFIPPNLDKNQHGRYVDIPANALVWLKDFQNSTGTVMPDKWRSRRQALEKRSGVNLPQNVLRHSFCSYRIALDQDYSKAAAIVGNSPAMLRKHYVQVLPKKQGRDYFLIKPEEKSEKKIEQFAAA